MCMNFCEMKSQLEIFNRKADMLHVDIMDGHFVKNLALSPCFIAQIRPHTPLPIDAHLMVENPADYVPAVAKAGAQFVSVHAEIINNEAFRILRMIRDAGMKPGLVFNPATPLDTARHYIHLVEKITLMTVDPGFAAQPFVPETVEKIAQLRDLKKARGLQCLIEVDGACNRATYAHTIGAGAQMLVAGSTGLFGLNPDLETAWKQMEREIDEALNGHPA